MVKHKTQNKDKLTSTSQFLRSHRDHGVNLAVHHAAPAPAPAPAAPRINWFDNKKSITATTLLLSLELAIVESIYIGIWTTKTTILDENLSPGRITSRVDHSYEICNVAAINNYSMQSQFVYHILNGFYVAFRLIHLFQAQLCQWKSTRDPLSMAQKRCNVFMIVIGLINIVLPLILMFYMVDHADLTIRQASDKSFGESIHKRVGFYHMMGFFWMWLIDILVFIVAWLGGQGGAVICEGSENPCTCASSTCCMSGCFGCVMLCVAYDYPGVHHSLNNKLQFVSLDLRVQSWQSRNISGDGDVDVDAEDSIMLDDEYNYNVEIKGDSYENVDFYQSYYIYDNCKPFHIHQTNYAGIKYKGARFDNIISVSGDEYELYVYCQRRYDVDAFIGCTIHKLDRIDIIIGRFYIDFLGCSSFDAITAAVDSAQDNNDTNTNSTSIVQHLVFTVCYDAFIVNMNH